MNDKLTLKEKLSFVVIHIKAACGSKAAKHLLAWAKMGELENLFIKAQNARDPQAIARIDNEIQVLYDDMCWHGLV